MNVAMVPQTWTCSKNQRTWAIKKKPVKDFKNATTSEPTHIQEPPPTALNAELENAANTVQRANNSWPGS